jgi:hypothetical protein
MNLPPKQKIAYFLRQQHRPTRCEIDSVIVDDLSSFRNQNQAQFVLGAYYLDFNLVRLNWFFVNSSKVSQDMRDKSGEWVAGFSIKNFFDDYNRDIPFRYAHEMKHAEDFTSTDFAGFSFDQMAQFYPHDEVAAYIAELLARRKVLLATGSLNDAFPAQSADLRGGGNWELMKKPFFWKSDKNSAATKYICESWPEHKEYVAWLLTQDSVPDEITAPEAEAIVTSVIAHIKASKESYEYEKALAYADRAVLDAWSISANYRPEMQIKIKSFDEFINSAYSFSAGGTVVNFLDIMPESARAKLFAFIREYSSDKGYAKSLDKLKESRRSLLDIVEKFQCERGIIPENSKYDIKSAIRKKAELAAKKEDRRIADMKSQQKLAARNYTNR